MRQHSYIFLFIATIIAMMGCEKVELNGDNSLASERYISYRSTVAATRATEMETSQLEEYGKFNIAAFLADERNSHYFSDFVGYNGSKWSSSKNRYWSVDHNINIYAYAPVDKDFIVENNSKNYSDYSIHYSCPMDVDKQIDLLAISKPNQSYTTENRGVVDLKLDHLLSSIKFNVKIESENNVTLNSIRINYIGIEDKRTYFFNEEKWGESENSYFKSDDGATTTIDINKTETSNNGTIAFGDIENQLMILPQKISHTDNDPHYISIQVAYTLNGALDANKIAVTTGIMPLPSPNSENLYKQGEVYRYNIVINGETIKFKDLSIEDQNDPTPAYGNINLGLITSLTTAGDIGYDESSETKAQYYFTTADRVRNLLNDGVRDFVVIGSMGADKSNDGNALGNGKLGYYGSESSPFFIGGKLTGLGSSSDDLFSIDLRGTYDYPKFKDGNDDNHEHKTTSGDLIDDNEPILIAGLFANIDWLDEVMLPHGIAAIGNHTFDGCDALQTIDIADVRHIEIGSFQNCKSLRTVENGKLTRIHKNGFDNCTELTSIDLSLVEEVEEYGFVNCNNLTEVNLSMLNDIGRYAFSGCSNLTLVKGTEIPGFTMVEDFAFSGCYRLGENGAKIDLVDATKVGAHAFTNCEHIQLSSDQLNSLLEVEEYGFAGCIMLGTDKEFKMPLLSSIGESSFSNCPNLNIITGLSNLEIIPYYAFQNCTSLTGYSSSATEKSLSLPLLKKIDGFGLFNTAVTKLEFTNNLTTIGEYALQNCNSLTTITGTSNVTSVGNYAFSDCALLEEINLPLLTNDNCGGYFFADCNSLKRINLPKLTNNDISFYDKEGEYHYSTIIDMISADLTAIESINLEALVLDIPEWHINNKPNLEYVNFASATSVGKGGFAGCSALKTLILTSATSVADYSFQGCSALEELLLSNVTGTFGGWKYFNDNTRLIYIDLSSVNELTGGTFVDCSSIEAIDLRAVTKLGEQPFANCDNIKRLNLSGLVDSSQIDEGAFWHFNNSSECEIWLSNDIAPQDDSNVWQGLTWKKIHKVSDNTTFTLK